VGGVHGPWVKLGGGKKDDKDKNKDGQAEGDGTGNADEKDVDGQIQDQMGGEEDGIPDPEALRRAADEFAQQRKAEQGENDDGNRENKEKKKPRKIEVRSK
jgi:hypothetical protein